MQHTPSQHPKVARPAVLHHAHPGFTRFMAEHPRICHFIAEHPKAAAAVIRVAHHIPILDHYVPIAPHISQVFERRARPRPRRSKFKI